MTPIPLRERFNSEPIPIVLLNWGIVHLAYPSEIKDRGEYALSFDLLEQNDEYPKTITSNYF